MRGLSCLIKSQVINTNVLLIEEAALLVFISLEAALKIIHGRLNLYWFSVNWNFRGRR